MMRLMPLMIFSFFLLCKADGQVSFNAYSEVGVSFLKSEFEDTSLFDPEEFEITQFRSSVNFSGTVGVQLTLPLNELFVLDVSLGGLSRGYQYKIRDFLEKPKIRATYRQYEVINSLGFKVFLFDRIDINLGSSISKKRRTVNSSSDQILPYVVLQGYQTYRLANRYRYNNVDESDLVEVQPNRYFFGFSTGLGFKTNQISVDLLFNADLSGFMELREVFFDVQDNDPKLRGFTMRISRSIN